MKFDDVTIYPVLVVARTVYLNTETNASTHFGRPFENGFSFSPIFCRRDRSLFNNRFRYFVLCISYFFFNKRKSASGLILEGVVREGGPKTAKPHRNTPL